MASVCYPRWSVLSSPSSSHLLYMLALRSQDFSSIPQVSVSHYPTILTSLYLIQSSQTSLHPFAILLPPKRLFKNPVKMCYQVIERYSVCRCLYYKHAIDPCAAHGQRGHTVQEKTVLVGYACSSHSSHRPQATYNAGVLPDSGYGSGAYPPSSLR